MSVNFQSFKINYSLKIKPRTNQTRAKGETDGQGLQLLEILAEQKSFIKKGGKA